MWIPDDAGIQIEVREPHQAIDRIGAAEPPRDRDPGLVLLRALDMPRPLPRPEVIQHRTDRPHQCDEHEGDRCPRNNPEGCRRSRRVCKPHVCEGLSASTIRQVHWIVSGALDRAVVWNWISVNPAEHADKPALPTPNPQPPTVEQAAQLILAAWDEDPDWGAFLWLKTTTGNRRGEMCGLHRYHREPRPDAPSVLRVERSIFVNDDGGLEEKDTKTHQHRRIVLDPAIARGSATPANSYAPAAPARVPCRGPR